MGATVTAVDEDEDEDEDDGEDVLLVFDFFALLLVPSLPSLPF